MTKTSRKSVSQAVPKKKPATPVKSTAVKKTAAAPKKRSTAPKKKPVTVKKASIVKPKATTRAKKTPTKTKTTKAETPKKIVKKAAASSSTKPTKKAKTTTNPTTKRVRKSDTPVVLPTRMSIRAREKVLVLADTFEKDFYPAMVTIAKVSGFCFLLIGSLFTYTQLAPTPAQTLTTVCADDICNVAQVSSAVNATAEPGTATNHYVELLADIPDIIENPLDIPVEFSSIQTVTAYVRHVADVGSVKTELTLESIGNNKYEIYVDPAELPANQYELMVTVKHQNTTKATTYSLGYFATINAADQIDETVLEAEPLDETGTITTTQDSTTTPQLETPATTTTNQSSASSASTTISQSVDTDSYEQSDEDVATTEQTPKTDANKSTNQPLAESIKTEQSDPRADIEQETDIVEEIAPKEVVEIKETTDKIAVKEPLEPVVVREPLRIATDNLVSGVTTATIANATKQGVVSFYIRPVQTLNTQFIGQLIPGTRTFRFDSRSFPNGRYQLYAQQPQNNVLNKSNAILFSIQNQTQTTITEHISDAPERESLDITKELPESDDIQVNEGQQPDQTDDQPVATTPDLVIQDRTTAMLRADAYTLDDLFQRYAVAQQSGDAALQAAAKKALVAYREQVIANALNDESDRAIVTELNIRLEEELNTLARKVDTFEAIRRERTESDFALDTDGDGISDFDEVALYNTDPSLPDTDNDGFTDGAEVIRGFNPTDAAVETAITYQSPRDSVGVIKTPQLQVTEVTPEIEIAANDTLGAVRTVVKGVGLPNSFVTLYIFSTPTVVTVRTETDGTFAYTFKQELDDGQHQVYVALTDNAGSIVAQSEPFTFVKEAQAFTAVNETETITPLTASDISNQPGSYRVVLGMSVFALGMLLILLGIGLRSNKPVVIVLEDKPV